MRWVKRFRALPACAIFGLAYGAAAGAAFGSVLALTTDSRLFLAPFGFLVGGIFGGIAGLGFGILGALIGGPWGWCVAGVLGGMAPGLYLLYPKAPYVEFPGLAEWLIWLATPGAIGGLIGLAAGVGIRKGRSALPGVDLLAAAVHDSRRPTPDRRTANPKELTPATPPAGRGDEASPAGEEAG
jgi:hypothetical protein